MVDPDEKEYTVHITVNTTPYLNTTPQNTELYELAMDSEEEHAQWWSGLQQHMLDQGRFKENFLEDVHFQIVLL